jgi:hypothetical protein
MCHTYSDTNRISIIGEPTAQPSYDAEEIGKIAGLIFDRVPDASPANCAKAAKEIWEKYVLAIIDEAILDEMRSIAAAKRRRAEELSTE